MKSETLRKLGARYRLGERQQEQLEALLGVLAADEAAPTSVREPAGAVDAHIADSLVALELEPVRRAGRIADIGAGAGFPGMALAVALPNSEVALVDSQARKCAFMERAAAAAGLGNVSVVCVRVERWPEGIGAHDLVLARALAPQPVVLEYAAPLLRLGGALVDWRGRREPAEEESGLRAAQALGLGRVSIAHVEPFEGARDRHLHVFAKARATPDEFPRRAGMARKRPLA